VTKRKKIITAGLWVIGAFGVSQFLRLGGNLIVTRMLDPEMFGIMAVVYVVAQGLAMFSDLGLRAYIIRHKRYSDIKMLNIVWTLQVIRGWLIFVVIAFIAFCLYIANQKLSYDLGDIFSKGELPLLLVVIGAVSIISGYMSLAPILVERELKRGKLELIDLVSQLVGVTVMTVWAWLSPSLWALVSSSVIVVVMRLVLTYKLFEIRHRLSWNKTVVKDVYHFGKWIFFASALTYLAMQGDKLIFSSYLTAAELGVYSIAFMLASVVTNVCQQITSKVWFPVLSRVANDKPEALKEKYYEVRTKQDPIVFFVIGIMISIAPKVIDFLYDERYQGAGWMIEILLIGVIGDVILNMGTVCMTALGYTKVRMKIMFLRAIAMFIGLPVLFYYFGFEGAVWGVALNTFIAIPLLYIEMNKLNILSLPLELRMVPLVILGCWSSSVLIL